MKKSKYKYRGKKQRLDPVGLQVSCIGKVKWWSKQKAQEHADTIDFRDRKTRPYKCSNCSTKDNPVWHVGREPKK